MSVTGIAPSKSQRLKAATDAVSVARLRLICAAIIVAAAIGGWELFPYLLEEHRRLEPWKIAGIWFGDAAAALWFARFTWSHALLGRPLRRRTIPTGRGWFITTAVGVTGALLIDLGFTLYLMRDEGARYEAGRQIAATAHVDRVRVAAEMTTWELVCHFRDERGRDVRSFVRVYQSKGGRFNAKLPADVADALSRHRSQFPIPLRYDPAWPQRSWVDGLGADDDNGLSWFSLLALFFQSMVMALFLLLLFKHSRAGWLPWWHDLHRILPLAVEAGILLLFGAIERLMWGYA